MMDCHWTSRVLFCNTRNNITGFKKRKLHAIKLPFPPQYQNCIRELTEEALEKRLHLFFMKVCRYLNEIGASAYFASIEDGAQVLCSEIGSEGRNFQFSHQLVLFDLPLLIGLVRKMTLTFLSWYHEGLNALEQTCSIGDKLYKNFEQRLKKYLLAPGETKGLDQLIEDCQKKAQALRLQLEQGRDRLIQLNSSGGESGKKWAEAILKQNNDVHLIQFAVNLFDIIGIHQEDHSDQMTLLTPSDHMLVSDFPGLSPESDLITFDRQTALVKEEAQFINWEHPIIRNRIDLILSSETGSASVAFLKNKNLPIGTLLTELIYVVEYRQKNPYS